MKNKQMIAMMFSAAMLASCGQRDMRVPSAQAIKMYQALYDAGTEAQLLLNDRAPHGNLGPEAASAIQTFVLRTLFPKEK